MKLLLWNLDNALMHLTLLLRYWANKYPNDLYETWIGIFMWFALVDWASNSTKFRGMVMRQTLDEDGVSRSAQLKSPFRKTGGTNNCRRMEVQKPQRLNLDQLCLCLSFFCVCLTLRNRLSIARLTLSSILCSSGTGSENGKQEECQIQGDHAKCVPSEVFQGWWNISKSEYCPWFWWGTWRYATL